MKKGQKRTIEKNWKGLFERKENGGKIPLPQKTKISKVESTEYIVTIYSRSYTCYIFEKTRDRQTKTVQHFMELF